MNTNIMEVSNLTDLKKIVSSHITIIIGFTLPSTPQKLKIIIRKFLKQKSISYPTLTFVYMVVSDKDRNTLSILKGDDCDYPKIYHIRDGKNILVEVLSATQETINESFNSVEKYYIDEINDKQTKSDEQHKLKEKIKLLTEKQEEMEKELLTDIMQRKLLEINKN